MPASLPEKKRPVEFRWGRAVEVEKVGKVGKFVNVHVG